jgi:hypothetical protein
MAAEGAPPAKKRKKNSPWFAAAEKLPQLPPGIPPKTKELSVAQRAARLALVRAFWPGVAGTGGSDICHDCRFGPSRYAWGACRGRGGGTRNSHGPNVPDWPEQEYPVGCRVKCAGFEGVVTGFDASSGFFSVTCDDATVKEVFLSHSTYKTVVGARDVAPCTLAHSGARGASACGRAL